MTTFDFVKNQKVKLYLATRLNLVTPVLYFVRNEKAGSHLVYRSKISWQRLYSILLKIKVESDQ